MHRAQRGIAVANRTDHDANTGEVVDIGEVASSSDHFLVDGIELLGSTHHLGFDFCCAQVTLDQAHHVVDIRFALRSAVLNKRFDFDVEFRIQHREGEVFQLSLDRLDSQAVCQRRIDVEGFLRLTSSRLGTHKPPGTGVMQSIGEFDHQHANVFGHRDNHFSHRFGLGVFAIFDSVELGDAVDEHCDFFTKLLPQRLQRISRVFDSVVEDGCGDGLGAQAQFGKNLRHRYRVGDVRLAGTPGLSLVSFLRDTVRAFDNGHVGARVIALERLNQLLVALRDGCAREESRQELPEGMELGLLRVNGHRTPPGLCLQCTRLAPRQARNGEVSLSA